MVERTIQKGIPFLGIRKLYEIHISVHRVLLEHSHTSSFVPVFGCLCAPATRRRDRALIACRAENIYSLALDRQSLQMPESVAQPGFQSEIQN